MNTNRREFMRQASALAGASVFSLSGKAHGNLAKKSDDELIYMSAGDLAALIREKKVSSEQVVRAHIDRIKETDEQLKAIVQLDDEKAIEDARKADAALAKGEAVGRLHGLPVTIKDNIETAGIVTTGGTWGRRAYAPEKDATVVKRLKDAGAIVLGKTNLPELAMAYETDNLVYGPTKNPYDVRRSPGGSSGGEAAAVAAGLSPLGIGNDGGGSIRLPAHWCGVAGLKDSMRRIPISGTLAGSSFIFVDFVSQGPMARSVDDLALALDILSGSDLEDPYVVPAPLQDYRKVNISDLRIAFFTDNGIATPTAAIRNSVSAAADALADSVRDLAEKKPPHVEETWDLFASLVSPGFRTSALGNLEMYGTPRNKMSPLLREAIGAYAAFNRKHACARAANREKNLRRWFGCQKDFLSFFHRWDAIMSPVCAFPAMEHGTSHKHITNFSYVQMGNVYRLPAVVVRCATSPEGLPIGVQVMAARWREDIALAVAKRLEERFGGFKPPAL